MDDSLKGVYLWYGLPGFYVMSVLSIAGPMIN